MSPACFFLLVLIFSLAALPSSPEAQGKKTGGVYHTVTPGVTLYRISQAYRISIAKLMEANKLPSPAVRVGQKLFIPGAKAVLKVEPYVPLSPAERKKLERSLEKPEPGPESPGKPPGQTQLERPPWTGKELDMTWPIQGKINSPYGPRGKNFHSGIDIASPHYQEVKAAMDGEVLFARDSRTGYGKLIVLRHDRGLSTVYGHLNVIIAREGEAVRQGQAIGGVGSTGRSTGPHLHFELREGGRALDPLPQLPQTIEDLLEKAGKR